MRLFVVMLMGLNGAAAHAQTRSTPSHGKTRLDSYNYLLRDVHPASQAQANYLQNLLYLQGVKKAERLERQERLDIYGERQAAKQLKTYESVVQRLSAGSPTSARSLASFWVLVSVFGDRAEVYDALSSDVPPMTHSDFVATSGFLQIVQPSGGLERPPLALEGMEDVDASAFQSAWNTLAKNMRAGSRVTSREAAEFRKCVGDYRELSGAAIKKVSFTSGRGNAERYLTSLGSLADALYRPQQSDQIQQYLAQGGYAYYGGSMLGMIQHMLKNRVTPAHGSTAQVALAELARPISRVLEQEMALHWERTDSLAAGEGHRPYAAEYRGNEEPLQATPGIDVTQAEPAAEAGS